MKCQGHMDVPYTCEHTRRVYWKKEPCECDAKPGRKFCMWHDKPDFLPPTNLPKEFLEAMNVKPNAGGERTACPKGNNDNT